MSPKGGKAKAPLSSAISSRADRMGWCGLAAYSFSIVTLTFY
jgi:hypothetical protein